MRFNFALVDYIIIFSQNMRKSQFIKEKPSIRQGIALLKLIIAHYLRVGTTDVEDLIDLSVKTSYYEDQPLARDIATQTIVNIINKNILEGKGVYSVKAGLRMMEQNLLMKDYLKDPKILEKLLDINYEKWEWEKLTDILFEAKSKNKELNMDDIKLLKQTGYLEKYLEEIEKHGNIKNEILAKYYCEDEGEESGKETGWKKDLLDLLTQKTPEAIDQFSSIINQLCENSDCPDDETEDLINEALHNVEKFEDYKEIIERTNQKNPIEPTRGQIKELSNTIEKNKLLPKETKERKNKEIFEELKEFEDNRDLNILSKLFKELSKEYRNNLSLDELISGQNASEEWKESFKQQLKHQSENSHKDPLNITMDLLKTLANSSQKIPSSQSQLKQFLQKKMQKLAKDMVNGLKNAQNLKSAVQQMQEYHIPIDEKTITDKIKELQSDEFNLEDLNQLMKSPNKKLENMIKQNLDDFHQFADIYQTMDTSMIAKSLSKSHRRGFEIPSTAWGAYAHRDLVETTKTMKSLGLNHKKNINKLLQGMAIGSGLNTIEQWFDSNNRKDEENIPEEFINQLKLFSSKLLSDLSIHYSKEYFSFIRHGNLIDEHDIRIYREGDSIEQVDIEATIENIIEQGKSIDHLTGSDILCKSEKGKKTKIMLMIDISGSMSGEKIAAAALASAMLTYSLKPEDLCVITFESNTTILKSFEDRLSSEEVAEILLGLNAGGGTQISRSIEFIADTFSSMDKNQNLILFCFSDFYFYEETPNLKNMLKKLIPYNINCHLFSRDTPNQENVELFSQFMNFETVIFPSIKEIPEILASVLRN